MCIYIYWKFSALCAVDDDDGETHKNYLVEWETNEEDLKYRRKQLFRMCDNFHCVVLWLPLMLHLILNHHEWVFMYLIKYVSAKWMNSSLMMWTKQKQQILIYPSLVIINAVFCFYIHILWAHEEKLIKFNSWVKSFLSLTNNLPFSLLIKVWNREREREWKTWKRTWLISVFIW
jgi:hypothetical protein